MSIVYYYVLLLSLYLIHLLIQHYRNWKVAYRIVFNKEFTGTGGNPLYAWFWVKNTHLNQQDPRLTQERHRQEMEEIGHEITVATLNLRELTGKEDLLLAVPKYQYSQWMWWVSEKSFLCRQLYIGA